MGKKILIIDDEADVMMVVVYRLKIKEFVVETAVNGKEGVNIARQSRPDLILLDYRLPDMEAKDVTAQIRACEGLAEAPIVLVTASAENISDKAQECGAVDYISKPIDPEFLYEKIAAQFG